METQKQEKKLQVSGKRVPILPLGGNKTSTARTLQEQNQAITMLSAQASADTVYDPPSAPRPTQAVIKESFQTINDPVVFITGLTFITVGLIFFYKSILQ